jgi:hypothetical protein
MFNVQFSDGHAPTHGSINENRLAHAGKSGTNAPRRQQKKEKEKNRVGDRIPDHML